MGTRDQVLLTVKEAAKFLNVGQATVYRLLHKGVLEKTMVTDKRGFRISLDSLEAYDTASTFSLPELVARLIKLERKMDFLLTQNNSAQPVAATGAGLDFAKMQKQMRKRHPGHFSN